jgi:hypothetical protein
LRRGCGIGQPSCEVKQFRPLPFPNGLG